MKVKIGNVAYHCATKAVAEQFLREVEGQGVLWHNGDKPSKNTYWYIYGICTCYYIDIGSHTEQLQLTYGNVNDYKRENYKIIEYTGNEEQITITYKGKSTTATLGNKSATVTCYSKDTYDKEIGRKQAIIKLLGIAKEDIKFSDKTNLLINPDFSIKQRGRTGYNNTSAKKNQFKVGDRVQFKSWEEMEKEFGIDDYGRINPTYDAIWCFTPLMKHLCGTYATINSVGAYEIKLKSFSFNGERDLWHYAAYMLKPASTKNNK